MGKMFITGEQIIKLLVMITHTRLIISTVEAISTMSATTTIEITTTFSHALHYIPLFYSLIHKLNINKNLSKVSLKYMLTYD